MPEVDFQTGLTLYLEFQKPYNNVKTAKINEHEILLDENKVPRIEFEYVIKKSTWQYKQITYDIIDKYRLIPNIYHYKMLLPDSLHDLFDYNILVEELPDGYNLYVVKKIDGVSRVNQALQNLQREIHNLDLINFKNEFVLAKIHLQSIQWVYSLQSAYKVKSVRLV